MEFLFPRELCLHTTFGDRLNIIIVVAIAEWRMTKPVSPKAGYARLWKCFGGGQPP
jgi:hypothetical protein